MLGKITKQIPQLFSIIKTTHLKDLNIDEEIDNTIQLLDDINEAYIQKWKSLRQTTYPCASSSE
jgi:hypothetical protein